VATISGHVQKFGSPASANKTVNFLWGPGIFFRRDICPIIVSKTRPNNIHQPSFSDLMTESPEVFSVIKKKRGLWPKK